ncbi:hypothetical protein LXA43DRAFT_1181187 [Ganoderma leucocontextum]|nr:hypothetical protein LXA43DRAFT_1181187 [Ganoderma leucocontextum]
MFSKRQLSIMGRVDVVVNNAAAYTVSSPSEESGADRYMQFITTSFGGPINLHNAFLQHMRARRSGTLILFGGFAVHKSEFMVMAPPPHEHTPQRRPQFTVRPLQLPCSRGYSLSSASLTLHTNPNFNSVRHVRHIAPDGGQHPSHYGVAREELCKRLEMRPRIQSMGDPARGMDALLDVVRGEGKAESKGGKMLLWLFLGDDSIAPVKARAKTLRGVAEERKEVGTRLGKDDA